MRAVAPQAHDHGQSLSQEDIFGMSTDRTRIAKALGAMMRRPPHNDPSSSQTLAQIARYYQNAKPGERAAIRQTQYGLLRFKITEIASINPSLGRIYLKQGAEWGGSAYYRKTGKNCYSPTGQTHLVVPTSEVLVWVEKNPEGTKNWN